MQSNATLEHAKQCWQSIWQNRNNVKPVIYIYVYQFILRSISLPFESHTVNHTALRKDKLNSNRLRNGLIHVQNYRSLFDLGKTYLALTSKNLELYVSHDKHNNYKTAIVLKDHLMDAVRHQVSYLGVHGLYHIQVKAQIQSPDQ